MPRKIYECIGGLKLVTTILVEGKETTIRFMGGSISPVERAGTFTTEDPKVIEALESANGFNKNFKLKYSFDDEPVKEKSKAGNKSGKDNKQNSELEEDGIVKVETVKTLQEAKEYLLEKFDELTTEDVKNAV